MSQVLLRGIPPDISYCPNNLEHECNLNINKTHSYDDGCPEITGPREIQMNTFRLIDNSMVFTSHASIPDLIISLSRQLFNEDKLTKLALQDIIKYVENNKFHGENNKYLTCDHISTDALRGNNDKNQRIYQELITSKSTKNSGIFHTHDNSPIILSNRQLINSQQSSQNELTTRLLYPHTRLPLVIPLPSNMPVFKNRLHHYHAIKRLFDDVKIDTLSDENAIVLHQRCFSLAKHPRAPGYHINAVSGQKARQELMAFLIKTEQELELEKLRAPEEKMKEDKEFRDLLEIARSLIPENTILDHTFPLNCLLGLTRDAASNILKHYHDSQGITKTTAFYRKRDTAFFIHHIFVILDKIYTEHALDNPSDTAYADETSDEEDHDQHLNTQPTTSTSMKSTSIVTPTPPSPTKKRKTDVDDSICLDMDAEFAATLTKKMILFTWEEIYDFDSKVVKQYIVAYAKLNNEAITEAFLNDTHLEDLKETLAVYTLELHVKNSRSVINGEATDDFIDDLDPIWAYFEYFTLYLSENNHDVSDVLFLEYDEVLSEIKSARDAMCMSQKQKDASIDLIEDSETDEDGDVHMFYPGFAENEQVNENFRTINTMFINTLQYQRDHPQLSEDDIHRDIMTILGLLTKDEIDCVSTKALQLLHRSSEWLAGDVRAPKYYEHLNEDTLRSAVLTKNDEVNMYRPLSGSPIPVGVEGLSRRDIKHMPKEVCQMILYRYYKNTDNPFKNTFGQNVTKLRTEIKQLVKHHIKKSAKPKSTKTNQKKNAANDDKGKNDSTPTEKSSRPSDQSTDADDKSIDISGSPPDSDFNMNTNDSTSPDDTTKSTTTGEMVETISTVLPTSTDDEINGMDIADARSEYFRLASPSDPKLTIDKVLGYAPRIVYDDLKRFRNKLLDACDALTQYHLTDDTTDDVLEKLNRAQCIFALKKYCEQQKIRIAADYFDTKTHFQLKVEVLNARDEMKKTANASRTETRPDTSKRMTNKSKKSLSTNKRETPKELAENLNGVNMSGFDPHKEQPAHDIRGPAKHLSDDDNNDQGHEVVSTERTVQTLHAKLETKESNINIPSWIKRLIVQMRKGDPSIMIIPFNSDSYQSSEVIGKEQELTDDENKLKTWVDNVKIVNTRLFFSMRIKTINIEGVKNAVFSWCKGNGRWVDFTKLSSSKIFTGGWFHKIHPFYYNRDDFSAYLFTHHPHLKEKLDIYQKTVYKWNDKKERIITPAIVIDGDFAVKDEALNFLYSHTFQGRYKNVTFVPYKSNDVFTAEDQIAFIKSNNEYQQNLTRIIIKVRGADTKHTINGRTFSFQDWLHNITIDKQHLIEGVEIAPDDVVRVLFHTDHVAEVTHAIHNLYKLAETVFGKDIAELMLDRENLQKSKTSHAIEKEHSKKLKAINVNANPQGDENQSNYSRPKQTRARGHYGTYLEVAQTNQTQTSEITNDTIDDENDLRKQVRDLTQAHKNLESSMTSTITSVVSNQIQPIQSQINSIQLTHQQQINSFMTLMKTMATNADTRFENIQLSLNKLGAPAHTPSEATQSPPGVGL